MTEPDRGYLATLAGGLAHEVRNPLNAMDLNLQLLEEELAGLTDEKAPRLRKRVGVIRAEVQRLNEILKRFLDFTRGPEIACRGESLNALLEQTLELISEQASRQGVRVMRALDPALPAVCVDPGILTQALLNLLLNALQAMPDGGDLMVRTGAPGDEVRVDIIDTGAGIPPEVAPRIYDAYYSTRRGGSGLGLALARRFVEAHRGRLEFTTAVGKGTDFTVILPRAPEPADE